MAKELVFKPNKHNCVIYSAIIDIKNHVYKAKRALELSKIDQENLILKVNEWAANDTKNKFFSSIYREASDTFKKEISESDA